MEFRINYQEEIKQQLELAKKQELIGNNPTIKVLELLDIDPTNEDCIEYLLDYESKVIKNTHDFDVRVIGGSVSKNRISITAHGYPHSYIYYFDTEFLEKNFKNEFINNFFTIPEHRNITKNIKACNNPNLELKLDEIKNAKKGLLERVYIKVINSIKEYNKPYEDSKTSNAVSIITAILSVLSFIFSIILAIANLSFILFIIGTVVAIILCIISYFTNVRYEDSPYYAADREIIKIID